MKKRISQILSAALAVCLLAVCLTGCGASTPMESNSAGVQTSDTAFEDAAAEEDYGYVAMDSTDSLTVTGSAPMESPTASESGSGTGISMPQDGRKVILRAEVGMETKEYDATLSSLLQTVSGMGGYISNREDYDYSNREVHLTLRIPSDLFDDFINGLPGIANVTRLAQSSQDITESYIETESYLNSLNTQQERLLELMEQAESLEDLLAIEDRLATVRAELQYYASLKNSYDNRISYSTIELTLWEVRDYTVVKPTFGEELWEVIRDTGSGFVRFLRDLLFFLIEALPYLVLITVVLIPLLRLHKKRRAKKLAAKEAAKAAEPPAPAEG